MNKNNRYLTLARREFWEHRGLWLAPTVVAGLLLLTGIFGLRGMPDGPNGPVTISERPPLGAVEGFGALSLFGLMAVIGMFAAIVGVIYLLDCLFAERKDRSILFWKSLPTSDAETVLVKLGVALVLLPLLVLALALVLQPILSVLTAIRFAQARPYVDDMILASLASLPNLLGLWVVGVLWYAPLATYLMLASVLARRTPIIYAVIPPVALGVAESTLLGTRHVWSFIGQRMFPWPQMHNLFELGEHRVPRLSSNWWVMLGEPALWLGLVAAGAMAYGVIRLRRYRDDT